MNFGDMINRNTLVYDSVYFVIEKFINLQVYKYGNFFHGPFLIDSIVDGNFFVNYTVCFFKRKLIINVDGKAF